MRTLSEGVKCCEGIGGLVIEDSFAQDGFLCEIPDPNPDNEPLIIDFEGACKKYDELFPENKVHAGRILIVFGIIAAIAYNLIQKLK